MSGCGASSKRRQLAAATCDGSERDFKHSINESTERICKMHPQVYAPAFGGMWLSVTEARFVQVLEIFCPNLNEYHILVWHLGTVFVTAVGGLAIGMIAEYSSWKHGPRKHVQ
jgi:hypothetical protein